MVISSQESTFEAGLPIWGKSSLQPFFRWSKVFRKRGITFDYLRPEEFLARGEGYEGVLIQSTAFRKKPIEEVRDFLAVLRRQSDRLVWLDQADSSGETRFEIIPLVDAYAKRNLLRSPMSYINPTRPVPKFVDYYASLLKFQVSELPLPARLEPSQLSKIRLSWSFLFHVVGKQRKIPRLWGLTGHGYPAPKKPVPIHLNHLSRRMLATSALFDGEGESFRAQSRRLALGVLEQAGALTLERRVDQREFLGLLASRAIAVSPFGFGEMCYRDFEIALVGRILAKPEVSHLVTFPQILNEGVTYLALSWDPRAWPDEIEEARGLDRLGHNLQNAYRDSVAWAGAERFVEHVEQCWLEDKVCAVCAELLLDYR